MKLARRARLFWIPSCLIAMISGCIPAQESGGGSGNGGSSRGGSGGSSSSSSASGGGSGSGGTSAKGGSGGNSSGGSGGNSSGGSGGNSSGGSGGSNSGGSGGDNSGGSSGSGGTKATGGTISSGGSSGTGGTKATGGTTSSGGSSGTGGIKATGGSSATGNCSFTLITNAISTKMATVGIVEWSTTLSNLSSAQIVYTLNNAASGILNKGGTAPVDLTKSNYHTLLLGLKQSSDYTFHIEATSGGTTCKSSDYTLPKTGTLSGAPTITRTATNASAQASGFIVTCGGMGGGGGGGSSSGGGAVIIDADGAVVWYSTGPSQCSRARMDYQGVNMWMLALNVQNSGGEMRLLSMDGQTSQTSISGLSSAHHDFTVLPGKIAAMVWTTTGTDPESNLVERAADGSGSSTTVFKIGSNLYAGGSGAMGGGSNTYHCNSILYHPSDDTYTIGDRNPNLYVKVKHDGTPVWQIGGSCTSAKAPKCASGTWQVNHGHDFDANGNLLIFNNGQSGSSHVFELKITESTSAISTSTVKDFAPGTSSNTLGDVQRLPNGNTVITYSNAGQILEVDSSWSTVQTLKGSFGYADWRATLYGPPER